MPKRLSKTHWSGRANARKAIISGYEKVKEALDDISNDQEQKYVVQNEVDCLSMEMCKLEIALYASFWNILERINATNHKLQDPKMVLRFAVMALKFLKTFVESKRDNFNEYEDDGKRMAGTAEYDQVRPHLRNMRLNSLDYGKAKEVQLISRKKFHTESFIPVIDQFVLSDIVCERLASLFSWKIWMFLISALLQLILSVFTGLTWSIALVMN